MNEVDISSFVNCEIYKDYSKEVPTLPTQYGGVEANKYRFETIHPGVGELNNPAVLIHSLIKQICLTGISPVSSVWTDIGYLHSDRRLFPSLLSHTISVMFEIGDESLRIRCKRMSHRKKTPLTTIFNFIKNA